MNVKHCLNCDSQINQTQNFCQNCGQQTKIHRFTLVHFFHEGFHAFTHADKGLFYLLKELTIRPGIVAREYIAGKRKKYYNPFTFFLILAAFYVLSAGLVVVNQNKEPVPEPILKIENIEKRKEVLMIYERAMYSKVFMFKHGNIVAMFAVPFFAFYFWLIYYRKKYNYSEHLVANLMFVSLANLAFSVIVYPTQTLLHGSPIAPMVTFLGFLLQWVYFVVAYKGFLQLKGFWPSTKVILSTIIGLVLWFFLTMIIMAIYVYQNSHFMDFFKYLRR
jgi:hypothetical protein